MEKGMLVRDIEAAERVLARDLTITQTRCGYIDGGYWVASVSQAHGYLNSQEASGIQLIKKMAEQGRISSLVAEHQKDQEKESYPDWLERNLYTWLTSYEWHLDFWRLRGKLGGNIQLAAELKARFEEMIPDQSNAPMVGWITDVLQNAIKEVNWYRIAERIME